MSCLSSIDNYPTLFLINLDNKYVFDILDNVFGILDFVFIVFLCEPRYYNQISTYRRL